MTHDMITKEFQVHTGGAVLPPEIDIEHLAIFDRVLTDNEISRIKDDYENEMFLKKTYKVTAKADEPYRVKITAKGDPDQTLEFLSKNDELMIYLDCDMPVIITSPDAQLSAELLHEPLDRLDELSDMIEKVLASKTDSEVDKDSVHDLLQATREHAAENATKTASLEVINTHPEEEVSWGTTLLAAVGAAAVGVAFKNSQVQKEKKKEKEEVQSG